MKVWGLAVWGLGVRGLGLGVKGGRFVCSICLSHFERPLNGFTSAWVDGLRVEGSEFGVQGWVSWFKVQGLGLRGGTLQHLLERRRIHPPRLHLELRL